MKSETFAPFFILLILFSFLAGCTDKMPYYFKGKVSHYPHSEVVNSMLLKDGSYAELETVDSGKKVLGYYKDHMSKMGWSIRVERESSFLALFKGDTGLMIDASTPNDDGKTRIALFMGGTNE